MSYHASAVPILSYAQPQTNHNGGWIGFGPDGYLYVSSGDGGGSFDSGAGHDTDLGNAQNLDSLLGKMLRLDVDGDDFAADADRNYAIPASNPFVGEDGLGNLYIVGLDGEIFMLQPVPLPGSLLLLLGGLCPLLAMRLRRCRRTL